MLRGSVARVSNYPESLILGEICVKQNAWRAMYVIPISVESIGEGVLSAKHAIAFHFVSWRAGTHHVLENGDKKTHKCP